VISAQTAFRISFGAALVVLLVSIYFAFLPMVPCGDLARNYAPVVAEELARTTADLHAIFGDAPGACRSAIAAKLTLVTWVDSLLFIPAYGAFLLFFFLGMVPRDEQSSFIGFVFAAVAVVADIAENICLFQVTSAPDVAGIALAVLPWATGIKWIALGLAGMMAGAVLLERGGENYPAAAACGLALLGSVLGVVNPHLFAPYLPGAIALSWLVFLVVAVRGAFLSTVAQLEGEDRAA
jgi:hypothetical protein